MRISRYLIFACGMVTAGFALLAGSPAFASIVPSALFAPAPDIPVFTALAILAVIFAIVLIALPRRVTGFLLVLLFGVAAAGCQSTDWGKVALGTGVIIGSMPAAQQYDPKIAKAAEQIAAYCPALQIAGSVAGVYLEKQRAAILQANAAVNEVCAKPPTDLAAAVIVLARAYQAAKDAKLPTTPS